MDNNLHKVETLTDEELEQIVGGGIEGFLPYD
ncbi:type A2 lanthipeptide [uncultured Lactobacillus sp.]|nr:type A2 lanthipeptide [uncultured Lactobacillus sp.]